MYIGLAVIGNPDDPEKAKLAIQQLTDTIVEYLQEQGELDSTDIDATYPDFEDEDTVLEQYYHGQQIPQPVSREPIDLERPIYTKDGRIAEIVATGLTGAYPLLVVVTDMAGNKLALQYPYDGICEGEDSLSLTNDPRKK